MQTDLFASAPETVLSVPPYLDPSRAFLVLVEEEDDGDHVAPAVAGVLPVGAVGNDAPVWVVRVFGRNDDLLHASTFPSYRGATGYADEIRRKLEGNRQADLFAAAVDLETKAPEATADDLPLFAA